MSLKVVTFGGGGGQEVTLKALKKIRKPIKIIACCPATDTGGSTGKLDDTYQSGGWLGDMVRAYAALTPNEYLSRTLTYRYNHGHLQGDTGGNLFLCSLEQVGSVDEAIKEMNRLCRLGYHRVLPVTTDRSSLVVTCANNKKIIGETNIDRIADNPCWDKSVHRIVDTTIEPAVEANPEVIKEIKTADWLVFCPGDLHTSTIPTLLPRGIKQAIEDSCALMVVIVNLMIKQGETDGYQFEDFGARLEQYTNRSPDFYLVNNTPMSQDAIARYEVEHKHPPQLVTTVTDQASSVRLRPLMKEDDFGRIVHDIDALATELKEVFKFGHSSKFKRQLRSLV